MTSLTVKKLGYDAEALEREYRKWQRERATQARKDFDQMLSENSFVEFWGRLSKMGGEGVDGGVKADDLGEDEGEAGGGKVDMKALAKAIHVDEMEKVLKASFRSCPLVVGQVLRAAFQSDKRYIVFDHAPEQREKWIRVRW
jgi:heat shock protein beta